MPEERFYVENRADQARYVLLDREVKREVEEIGEESYRDFEYEGAKQRILYHTRVSENYGGLGLARLLVRHAINDTVAAGRAIVPVCPYVVKWLAKHSEYSKHVVNVTPEHLEAVRSSR